MGIDYSTETLSLGGGIVVIDDVDIGFCPKFSVNINSEKAIGYRYVGYHNITIGAIQVPFSILKVPFSRASKYTAFSISGAFTCESFTDKLLSIFSRYRDGVDVTDEGDGEDSVDKWETTPFSYGDQLFILPVHELTFSSTPFKGRQLFLSLKEVFIEPNSDLSLISPNSWNSISFSFTAMSQNIYEDYELSYIPFVEGGSGSGSGSG